ncbi:MAG: ABC transporter ATP-binding protein [Eubacteriaceae bacterium]|nr:ABC transporter ATP-binding protein [Eubacteriaceae bacterium]
MDSILTLTNVSTTFNSRDGYVKAVSGVDLDIAPGEIVGLVGETGCGKSVLGQTILRLTPPNAVTEGSIVFNGEELTGLNEEQLQEIRGRRIAYINQNPSESLDPVMNVGNQIMESIILYERISKKAAAEKTKEILKSLSFEDPETIMTKYPVELSGGMKQRIMVAMAMCGRPPFMIADEPTKGLDALIRGQVIESLRKFIDYTHCAGLIITHDLKFARVICDRIALMYAGEIVEIAPKEELFLKPLHPYLEGLIASMPQNGMHVIEGMPCSLIDLPEGCRFHERCRYCTVECSKIHPGMKEPSPGHEVRCSRYD